VYQGEYGEPPDSQYATTEILDSDGAGGVALGGPRYSFCDSSDNVYVVSGGGDLFKITSALVKSNITSKNAILTHLFGGTAAYTVYDLSGAFEDTSNSCVYIELYITTVDPEYHVGIKITFAGVVSTVYNQGAGVGTRYHFVGLNSTGTIMYAMGSSATSSRDILYSITGPGVANTIATVKDFGTYVSGSDYWSYGPYVINSDDMYYMTVDNGGGNYYFGILSNIDGTTSNEQHDTGLDSATYTMGRMLVVSSSKVIVTATDGSSKTSVFEGVLDTGVWTFTLVVNPYTANSFTDYRQVGVDSEGDYTLGGYSGDYVRRYSSTWSQTDEFALSGVTDVCGVSHLLTAGDDEKTLIICGNETHNVYKVENTVVVLGDTEPTMKNTIMDIVSNYNDLGIANEKRISRAYLDIDCKYPGCGAFTLEPDYGINYYTHTYGETTEPTGATSLRPFQHHGHYTWKYTNSQFDSDVEQWQSTRLDVGTKGTAIRYSIRVGDVATGVTGLLRVRPPKLEVQVKQKI
jgi:hypothetical protein